MKMVFEIRWSRQAENFLPKLHRELALRITRKVHDVKDRPFHFLEHFEGADFFKLRIGSYRLLIDVDLHKKILFVRIIGHRRNVYQD